MLYPTGRMLEILLRELYLQVQGHIPGSVTVEQAQQATCLMRLYSCTVIADVFALAVRHELLVEQTPELYLWTTKAKQALRDFEQLKSKRETKKSEPRRGRPAMRLPKGFLRSPTFELVAVETVIFLLEDPLDPGQSVEYGVLITRMAQEFGFQRDLVVASFGKGLFDLARRGVLVLLENPTKCYSLTDDVRKVVAAHACL